MIPNLKNVRFDLSRKEIEENQIAIVFFTLFTIRMTKETFRILRIFKGMMLVILFDRSKLKVMQSIIQENILLLVYLY